jgi:succinate-acetate transporter protein
MSNQNGGGWANPMPAGVTALAIAVFIFYGMFTGKVGHGALIIGGIWLICGFFVQLIVGIIELREGSSAGGNTFTWFSAYFMLATGLVWVFEYFAGINGWEFDPRIAGFTWLAITLVLWLQIPSFAKTMPLIMFILILVMDLSLPFITGINLGLLEAAKYGPIAGNMAGIAGLLGCYSAAAAMNNAVFGRQILPFPGPIIKDK